MHIVCLSLAVAFASTATAAQPNFTEIVIEAGFRVEQDVLSANLGAEGTRHVVLAGRDDNYAQRLAVYRLEQSRAQLVLSLTPGAELVAYDVGRLGGNDSLIFIAPGRILRYDFDADDLVEVAQVNSLYGQERAGEIIPLDFFRDLNEDERDDLVLPDVSGYRVRLQREDGSFGEESLLQQSVILSLGTRFSSFEQRPLHTGDMNFDGLTDLLVWRGDAFRLYPQLPGARFLGRPQVMPLGLDLPTEAQMRAQELGRGADDQSQLTEKRIWSVEDFNDDNLPDILTEATHSEGVFDKRNEFRIHLGQRDGDRVVYRNVEDTMLASAGLQFGLTVTDIDGDGRKDLFVRKVRMNLGRVIAALFSGTVPLQIQFFRMTEQHTYPERANYVTKTKVQFNLTSGQVDIPVVEVADFDGDGLQDLAVQDKGGHLALHRGEATARLFAKVPQVSDVVLPRNGELVAADDIDNDGRSDLIIRYNAADGEQAAQIVRLLLSESIR